MRILAQFYQQAVAQRATRLPNGTDRARRWTQMGVKGAVLRIRDESFGAFTHPEARGG